jgi:hypothetical protein
MMTVEVPLTGLMKSKSRTSKCPGARWDSPDASAGRPMAAAAASSKSQARDFSRPIPA